MNEIIQQPTHYQPYQEMTRTAESNLNDLMGKLQAVAEDKTIDDKERATRQTYLITTRYDEIREAIEKDIQRLEAERPKLRDKAYVTIVPPIEQVQQILYVRDKLIAMPDTKNVIEVWHMALHHKDEIVLRAFIDFHNDIFKWRPDLSFYRGAMGDFYGQTRDFLTGASVQQALHQHEKNSETIMHLKVILERLQGQLKGWQAIKA